MFTKHITTGLVATALLTSVAFAQTPSSTSTGAASTSVSVNDSSFQGDWRTSKLVGVNVYNDNNESVGSISDLLTDHSGNIKAAVVGVGGFLGVGEHLVAIPFEKLKFVNDPIVYAAGTNANGNAVTRPNSTVTTGAATGTATTSGPAAPTAVPGAMNSGSTSASTTRANPWYPDHAVLNVTKDELKAMPEFKYTTSGSAN